MKMKIEIELSEHETNLLAACNTPVVTEKKIGGEKILVVLSGFDGVELFGGLIWDSFKNEFYNEVARKKNLLDTIDWLNSGGKK